MAVNIIIYYCSYCIWIKQNFYFNLIGHIIMCATFLKTIFGPTTPRTNDPSDQRPFWLMTLLTNDPSNQWPFGITPLPRCIWCIVDFSHLNFTKSCQWIQKNIQWNKKNVFLEIQGLILSQTTCCFMKLHLWYKTFSSLTVARP